MSYMTTEARREQLLDIGLTMAERGHFSELRRDEIAKRAKTATGTVSRVFADMDKFKNELVRHAVRKKSLPVIGQAIAARHPAVKRINAELKQAALAAL